MTAQPRPREVIQTHISVVTLTPQHAFKRKKPLALWGLLDYSTPERRLHWCQEELRLNRRLASDLYLRVARLGPCREPVVVMRRFAATDTLEARLASGRAGAVDLRRLGERIERFHREHPLVDAAPRPMARAFARVLHGNLRATANFCPGLFPTSVHRLLERTLARRLRGQRRELVRRIAAGWGVDGHGDLRLEHVVLEDSPGNGERSRLSIVDGVEFNPALRQVDGLSDLAFLVMELQARGHGDLVPALLEGYGRPIDPDVLALFAAYRAHVRAKVAAVTSGEPELPAQQRQQAAVSARAHLSLALAYAHPGPPALILLRGRSGSGKSHLGRELAPWLLADHHRSDVIRKQEHGFAPLQRPSAAVRNQLYSSEANIRTEAALLAAARRSLEQGRTVLLDATHLRQASRQRAVQTAEERGSPWLILDLQIPEAQMAARLERRQRSNDDPSDADLAIARQQLAWAEPLEGEERAHALEHHPGEESSQLLLAIWGALSFGPASLRAH
ncbi:AAA family ATPase [Cyanobium sp. Morenito 9A2]|uniref:bifunctional aminoglycoside phosphotransferase/ATP-binding protein n=1 Tax=Cyanobium sp. Morenito 9A2 TaxID=2823718 RepID=UPI0020CCF0C9|nr:AAA family ATPase [Cyanobium sp. Morenito 9A2]MCP9849367.1 AAA family ATPase [Cyanobium sp. Morenito 9A2]